MKLLDNILQFNQQFVERQDYQKYQTSKFPDKRMVILSCMDTRLVEPASSCHEYAERRREDR